MIARGDADGEDTWLIFQGNRRIHQGFHRPAAGVVEGDVEDDRRFDNRRDRAHIPAGRAGHQFGGFDAPFPLVDVGTGLVDNQPVGIGHQLGWHIAVIVVGDDQWKIRPHQFPHPAHCFAVGLGILFRHHRAVQGQEKAVQGHSGPDGIQQFAHEGFVGFGGQRPGWGGVGGKEGR